MIEKYFKIKIIANEQQMRQANVVQDVCKEIETNMSYKKAWG